MGKSAAEVFELVYLVLIGGLILLGNVLVIMAFAFGPRRLRTYTNYFVVNLAVSDLMVGCTSVPFWICVRFGVVDSSSSQLSYMIFLGVDIMCGTTSILCLTAISLERMFAVKHPTRHHNLSGRPVVVSIALIWIFGLGLAASKFLFGVSLAGARRYTVFVFVLAFAVPLVVILASYAAIFHGAKSLMTSNPHGTKELQVAKTISIIIGLFVVCWTPFFVVNMLFLFCDTYCRRLPVWMAYVAKALHYSNSMMNFFVYAVKSPDFRATFKALVFKCDASTVRERLRTMSYIGLNRANRASMLSTRSSALIVDGNQNQRHSSRADSFRKSLLLKGTDRHILESGSSCTDESMLSREYLLVLPSSLPSDGTLQVKPNV